MKNYTLFSKLLLFVLVYLFSSCSELVKKKDLDPELKSKTSVSRNGTKIIDVTTNNCREIFGYQTPPYAIVLQATDMTSNYVLIISIFYDKISDIFVGKTIGANLDYSPHFIASIVGTSNPYARTSWHTEENGSGSLTVTALDPSTGVASAEF
ncbi:hypothetical protein L0663_04935 [Dyadobacter sp. CY107]|uniref:hypothetical protein n=1 Tax=Dyadobacter fanqingshengii TaxID=2906443 RepID=UPI001F3286F4|nr:hypothetical protein [Dyadobacter fanqingshengii]MCF2502711.1 hypothetical protein [Dyadobacter fanqingshengii]